MQTAHDGFLTKFKLICYEKRPYNKQQQQTRVAHVWTHHDAMT